MGGGVELDAAAAVLVGEVEAGMAAELRREEEEARKGCGGWTFWAKGRRRYGGGWAASKEVDLEPKRSRRLLGKAELLKGGAGIPVNSCTMALKLVVSVVSTVVGARLDARDLFFGLRAAPWFWLSGGATVGEPPLSAPNPDVVGWKPGMKGFEVGSMEWTIS